MKVDTQHRLYTAALPYWTRLRDAIQGEDAIKEKGKEYLPMPPGLGDGIQDKQYANYKARARYPEMVGPAVEGMVGLMNRKIDIPELPESLKYLNQESTPDGLPLRDLVNRIWHEASSVGRYILFVDVPEDGGDPYIATYPAEAVINWRSDGDRITLVVFYEEEDAVNPNDPFQTEAIPQWRVASIEVPEEGGPEQYVVRIYRKDADTKEADAFYVHEEFFPRPMAGGESINYVPVVFVGSRDLLPDPDAMPLNGVANKSLHYYRQYADYAMQLFMCANGTTPYVAGATKDESPKTIGPTVIWEFEAPDAKAGFIEVSGTGLDAQAKELEKIQSEIAHETVRVLGDKKAAEAAETLRLRFQSQTATLSSISTASMAGLVRALRFAAEWKGLNPEEVKTPGPVEFITDQPDAQLLSTLYDGMERGYIPDDLIINYTRKVELHDMDADTYRRWSAGMMAEGGGEED